MSILSVDTIQPIGSGSTVTLNAAKIVVGTGITFESNGQAIYAGIITATSFSGSGANLTSLPAANLTGTLPAISGANLTSLPSQVTINNASGNRVITSDGGTTLNGEDTLRYDGTNFLIGTNTEAPYSNRNLTVAAGGSGSTTTAIEIRSATNGTGRIIFSDGTSADSSANEGQVIYQQSDHKMLFGVAANYQNMALESTGGTGANLNLIDGNLKFASGHGIDFSASGNAGGMTSELLDDYEEGTWTPTLASGTATSYLTQWYVKIGTLVTCYFYQYSHSDTSSSTHYRINGLPFAHATNKESFFHISVNGNANFGSGSTGIYGRIGVTGSATQITFYRGFATSTASLTHNEVNTAHFAATFSYHTT